MTETTFEGVSVAKVLVINEPFAPDFCRTQRWAARTRGRVLRAPDWLAYATAVLEKDGVDVELHDFPAKGWDKPELEALVKRTQPRIVVLDATTPSIDSDIECARICKRESPQCRVIMVGPHVASLPEETLNNADGAVDAVAIGEYEYTVRDYVRQRLDGDDAPLAGVLGLAWRDESGAVTINAPRPPIENLDELPFPAWGHLDLMAYFDGTKLHPYVDVIGGRGCPFKCSFCLWPQVMHGHTYRLRSVENILDEMEWVLETWPEVRRGEFFFEDDTFTADRARAKAFCEGLIERGLDCTWSINVRADIRDEELLRLMKRAGCRMLIVGFESANQEILDRVGKQMKVPRMTEFVHLAKKAKLQIHGCFVLGLPGENRDTMENTIQFALNHPLDTVQFSGAVPFPGTSYFKEMKSEGLLLAKNWNEWLQDGEQAPIIAYPGLSREEIQEKVDSALKRFYFRPSYVWRFLLATRSRKDLYRKVRGFIHFMSYLFSSKEKSSSPSQ
ncbi:MAG: radical SAM protein [Magnetococcales bacterium]|nr:radical SAM protein [Magnetococcales bacterium]